MEWIESVRIAIVVALKEMEWNGSILIAAIVAFIGIYVTKRNHSIDNKNMKIQARKERITQQLVEFYVPIMTYLHTSKAISRKLLSGKPKNFNLLTYLLDKDFLFDGGTKVTVSDEDLRLLDEIIALSEKITDIVVQKAGLVEDSKLNIHYNPNSELTDINLDEENKNIGLLGLLISHYKVIGYARKGIIQGDVTYYDQFKFPREVVPTIEKNYKILNSELEKIKFI